MRGATAGVIAAAAWACGEPLLGKAFGTPFSDVRLLGRVVTHGRAWPVAGVALHLANGAAFGTAFERLGLRGVRLGILAAQVENLLVWPGMFLVDRTHPDRRDGSWPRLATDRRVVAYEVATHALFGAVLGALARPGVSFRSMGLRPELPKELLIVHPPVATSAKTRKTNPQTVKSPKEPRPRRTARLETIDGAVARSSPPLPPTNARD